MPRTEDYVTGLRERLADPELSAAYLKACLEDPDPRVFLLALRDVAEANGTFIAESPRAQRNCESLYRALSEEGNLSVQSLTAILGEVGLKLSIEPADTVNLANRDELLELRKQALRSKIATGVDSLRRGEGIDGEEFFRQLEAEEKEYPTTARVSLSDRLPSRWGPDRRRRTSPAGSAGESDSPPSAEPIRS